MANFLFVNPIDPLQPTELGRVHLGIGYLVSSLRRKFGEKAITFKIVEYDVEREIARFKPDIIGITTLSLYYNRAIETARIAKKYDIPVITGGIHTSMLPFSMTKDMDVGVIGEGEETICELFELFEKYGALSKEKLREVRGIAYWSNDRIQFTPARELINPLDKIPFPARDLFKIEADTHMFTSRGCPYRCVFCCSSRYWNKVRFFSSDYVVNEIEFLIDKYKVKHIHLYDDLFIANVKRIEQIARLLEERDTLGKITFSTQARADMIDDKIAKVLKKLGIIFVGMGLESGCQKTLDYLKAGTTKVEDNERAIEILKKYGIQVYGSFIIGSPKDTRADILETLKFIKRSRLDLVDVFILTPFPGTPVWDYAESKGLVSDKMDWDKLDMRANNYESAVVLSEEVTKEELFALFELFLKEQKRREIIHLVRRGLRNPLKISEFLLKKIKLKVGKIQ